MNPLRRDASWAMATSTGNSFGNVQLTSQLDHRVMVILLNCAIYLLLQAVHTFYVTDIFKSEGFLPKFDDDRAVLSFFLVLVFSFFIGGERRPSHFFLQLGMALIVIPSLVLFAGSGLPIDFILITLGAYTLVGVVAVSLRFSLPDGIGMRPDTVITPICLGMVAFVGSIFAYGGGQFLNFDFGKVYQFRSEASENLPAIYRYLVPIFTQAVIPFGLAIALAQRRLLMAGLIVLLSVLAFALSGHKGPLFFPALVVAVYVAFAMGRISLLILLGTLAAVAASFIDLYLETQGLSEGWIGAIVADRLLLLPSLLDHYYIDFFSKNPQYYWSESRITYGLVDRPFDLPSPKLIGEVYFPQYQPFANTGWIGSGYAQAGLAGVALYSVGVGLVFAYVDAAAKRFGARTAIAMFVIHVVHLLTAVDFITSFLTGGLLFSVLLAAMTGSSLRAEDARREQRRRQRRAWTIQALATRQRLAAS